MAKASGSDWTRRLLFGDNLEMMSKLPPNLVDLIYLDPPFNSNEDYNVLFDVGSKNRDLAQWTAFKDTWIWDDAADEAEAFVEANGSVQLATLVAALKLSLGKSPMMAYIANMAARRRTFKAGLRR